MSEYTEGILCGGVVILKDGLVMSITEQLDFLNSADRLTKENEQLKKTLEDIRMLATYPMQD